MLGVVADVGDDARDRAELEGHFDQFFVAVRHRQRVAFTSDVAQAPRRLALHCGVDLAEAVLDSVEDAADEFEQLFRKRATVSGSPRRELGAMRSIVDGFEALDQQIDVPAVADVAEHPEVLEEPGDAERREVLHVAVESPCRCPRRTSTRACGHRPGATGRRVRGRPRMPFSSGGQAVGPLLGR